MKVHTKLIKAFGALLIAALLFAALPAGTAKAATSVGTAAELSAALLTESEITVTADILVGLVDGNAFTISSGKTVTLDLNGYTISAETSNGAVVKNAGTLTIVDNSVDKGGKIINTNTTQTTTGEVAKSAISNTGVLTVNSGVTVAGPADGHGSWGDVNFNPAYGIDNLGGGKVTVNGATISGAYGLRNFANVPETTITINGGIITGKTGIAMQSFGTNSGTLTINGDTIVTATTGSAIYAAGVTEYNQIVINGGTFSGENDYGTVCVVDGTVTINGGTFIDKKGTYSLLNYDAIVAVTAGTFNGDIYGGDSESGGLTTFNPSEGKCVTVNGEIDGNVDGENLVNACPVHNVTQGIYHNTIQEAIDAASPGDTINVAAGSYVENLSMPHPVNLIGVNMPIIQGKLTIDHSSYSGSESTLLEGIRFETLIGTAHDNIVLKGVDGITIKGCEFDGANKFMTGGERAVQMSSPTNNVTIEGSTFENGYYVTIQGSVTALTVKNSIIENVKSGINLQGGSNLVVEDTTISVIAQSAENDTYGIRFASSTGTAENMTVSGGSISVDKKGLVAAEGTYHSAIVLREAASGVLSVEHIAIDGEVVNLSSTLLGASPNWWGSTEGPATGSVVGNVKVNPWCYNETCTELYVAEGGLIQDAIDAASDGDTIHVAAGTFSITQAINVNKRVAIEGTGIGQTVVETAGTDSDPVSMFNVSADGVTISDMTIKHKKTSNTSVEAAITLSKTSWPDYTPVLDFTLDSCRIEYMEFAVTLRGGDWVVSNNEFVYTGPSANSNRVIGLYGTVNTNVLSQNTFVGSDDTTGTTDFVYLTSSGLNETYAGILQLVGNEQTGGYLRHFYIQDVFSGAGLELFADGNTTTALNGNFILYAAGAISPLDHFTSITLLNNSVSNERGKGLLALDGDSGLKDAGNTTLILAGNVLDNPAVTADGYLEAGGSTGGLVGYKSSVFNAFEVEKPLTIYADDDWIGTTPGADPDGAGPATIFGYDAFATVQDGIDAVAEGGTVEVGAGTYVEVGQIVIDKNLTIVGADKTTTVIQPAQDTGSTGDARGWFLVQSGVEFNLSNVTLDGEGKQVYQAIRSLGTGTINNNIFKNIRYDKYYGFGVVAMGGNMTFSNNAFSNIGRVGMMAYGSGVTDAQIINNTYIGKGDGDHLDYGIEIGGGAKATIAGNTISGIGDSTTDWSSAAILVTDAYPTNGPAAVTITNNTLANNYRGIHVGHGTSDGVIVVAKNNSLAGTGEAIITTTDLVNLVDGSPNWFGNKFGPTEDQIDGNVTFVPWCGDAGCETLMPDEDGVIDLTPPPDGEPPEPEEIQNAINNAPSGSTIVIPEGEYAQVGAFVVSKPNLTIKLSDGTVIQNSSPCFVVNASYTQILAEPGAKCIPTEGSNGIDVAADLTDIRVKGLEIDGSGQSTGDGIHFAGVVNGTVLVDNKIHDLGGDGIEFVGSPTGTVDIHGNLFAFNGGDGINNSDTTSPTVVAAEYNSWGSYYGPTGEGGDGVSANVDYDPYTYGDFWMSSSGSPWVDQVVKGQTITYTIKALVKEVNAADVTFTYPEGLTVTASQAIVTKFESGTLEHDTGTRTFTYVGMSTNGNENETVDLFSVTFTASATMRDAVMDIFEGSFGMAGVGSSSNVYVQGIDDGSITVIDLPTLTSTTIAGPYLAGIPQYFFMTATNPTTGGDFVNSIYYVFTIANTLTTDIDSLSCNSIAVSLQQSGDDVVGRVGWGDAGHTLEHGENWENTCNIKFKTPKDYLFTVNMVDNTTDVPADDIPLTSLTETAVVNGNFAITGTFSMQGRVTRGGIPVTLTWLEPGWDYAASADTEDLLVNNFQVTVTYGGSYRITTNQPRYLNVPGATPAVSNTMTLPDLYLYGGNANGDNAIGIGDASVVGGAYGIGDIGSNGDVNFDNRVNIQDLALVGGNYGLTDEVYNDWLP